MAKKLIIFAALFLVLSASLFAEIELGFGIAPPLQEHEESMYDGFFYENTGVLHFGYSFWWLFYASYDALLLPPSAVAGMTGTFNEADSSYSSGIFRPGILSLIDVGFRPQIGPILLMATTGINNLYIYKQEELEANTDFEANLGVNLRLGVGLKINKFLGIMASGTVVFATFDDMSETLKNLAGNDVFLATKAEERILNNLYPAIVLNLHF